jgi:MICOS complex subunit MIC12
VESLKDRWNDEVEGAVRWVQGTDWDGVREDAEGVVSRAWGRLMGRTGAERVVEDVKGQVVGVGRSAVQKTKEVAVQTGKSVVDRGQKFAQGTAAGVGGVKDYFADEIGQASSVLVEKGGKAGQETKSLFARGLDKGKELVGLTKDHAGRAKETMASADGGPLAKDHLSDVERALHQRYERHDGELNRSVDEVLKERYRPMDKRDNTVLRGV